MATVSPAAGARFVLQFPLKNQLPEAAPIQSGKAASAGEIQPAMTAPASSSAVTLVEQDNLGRRDALSLGQISSSLRANGSRERAPDDGLPEEIQSRRQDWICFVAALLATTEAATPIQPLRANSGARRRGYRRVWRHSGAETHD